MDSDQLSEEELKRKLDYNPHEYEAKKGALAERKASPTEYALLEVGQAYGLLNKIQTVDNDYYLAEVKDLRDQVQHITLGIYKEIQRIFECARQVSTEGGMNRVATQHSNASQDFEKDFARACHGIMKQVEGKLGAKDVPADKSEVKWLINHARIHANAAAEMFENLGQAKEAPALAV